jgi:hypothetical protein
LQQLEPESCFYLLILLILIKCENCWSKLKEYLRIQKCRTNQKVAQAISKAINLVTEKDIIGWFRIAVIMFYSIKNSYEV